MVIFTEKEIEQMKKSKNYAYVIFTDKKLTDIETLDLFDKIPTILPWLKNMRPLDKEEVNYILKGDEKIKQIFDDVLETIDNYFNEILYEAPHEAQEGLIAENKRLKNYIEKLKSKYLKEVKENGRD